MHPIRQISIICFAFLSIDALLLKADEQVAGALAKLFPTEMIGLQRITGTRPKAEDEFMEEIGARMFKQAESDSKLAEIMKRMPQAAPMPTRNAGKFLSQSCRRINRSSTEA